MTKPVDTNSRDGRQAGKASRPGATDHAILPDPDNPDPWAAGYAAGLRATGSSFVDDDHVDPRVVLVRLLPEEFEEEPIAKATLIELGRRVKALERRMTRIEDRAAPTDDWRN